MDGETYLDHAQRFHRFHEALAPSYFRLDERTDAELIAFAVELARLLVFHEPTVSTDADDLADWTDIFKADVTFLLATMCTVDTRREFYESIAGPRASEHGSDAEIRDRIVEAGLRIDRWYVQALETRSSSGGSGVEEALRATLADVITKRLARLISADQVLEGQWPWDRVNGIWDIDDDSPFALHGVLEQGVEDIYNEFNRATAQLVTLAREYLARALEEKSDHPAHGALYLAFVSLLAESREHLNSLTERHLDFYYLKVLRLRPRDAAPDTAHVVFELAPTVDEHPLSRGTLLVAGKDPEGEDIHYRVDEDVVLGRARVVALRSLALPTDADIAADILGHPPVAGVLASPVADSADGLGTPLEHPERGWPTFGASPGSEDAAAGPGLMIGSPVLRLSGGERRIEIRVRFADGEKALSAAMSTYREGVQSKFEGPLERRRFLRFLSDAFLFAYSTADGFRAVPHVSLDLDPDDGGAILVSLLVGPSRPAMAADVDFAVRNGIDPSYPLIRMTLNPLARAFAYSFLTRLEIESVRIGVRVRGLENLRMGNDLGPVDVTKAFEPFGPLPAKGAALRVACQELRGKTLEDLSLRLDWANLPEPPDDLAGHYSGYAREVGNDDFRAVLELRGDAGWAPLMPAQPGPGQRRRPDFALFVAGGAGEVGLMSTLCRRFEVEEIRVAADDTGSPDAGCLRLTLASPAWGFGSALYPQLLVDTVAANAVIRKVKARKPLPKEPFVPALKRVRLDYRSSAEVSIGTGGEGAIYHSHPFGGISRETWGGAMVPTWGERGYLMIGLEDVEPSRILTLLFHMRDGVVDRWVDSRRPRAGSAHDRLSWRYLSNDRWRELHRDDLIADATMGFTRSGIVKLRIPRDMTPSATLMGAGRYWLRAGATRDPETYGRMIGVRAQAVTATRVSESGRRASSASVPAGTITGLANPVAQVSGVSQPFPSGGGRAAESGEDFRVRVSERLRHKQRAIHPGDYESLVMEAFPEIREAKAFNHGAGRVVVAVVPMTPDPEPRVPEHLLVQIAEHLRGYASPFVEEICVRNPWYEPLEVSGWVKFSVEAGDDALPALERALRELVAPWRADPTIAMDIGTGALDLPKLRAFIERQSSVHQLTGLSVVHTYKTEQGDLVRHRLRDSARSKTGYSMFRSSSPWSVLVPAARHHLRILRDNTGIGDLEISGDFVVTSRADADLLARGELRFPRRPARAGIGNLAIGRDFIMTTEEDAVPDT